MVLDAEIKTVEIRGLTFPERIPVLDDIGFVRLVDFMGDDGRVVDAARNSYNKGTFKKRTDAGLVRYLLRNRHTTPVENVRFTFHSRHPIFVARQWIRHRTGTFNEESARYSVLQDDFYIPALGRFRKQDTKNRQGSSEDLVDDPELCQRVIENHSQQSYRVYQYLLEQGVARETARVVLPTNIYTQWYWTTDLHNLMGFLALRLDSHAQWEIQQYAKAILELAEPVAPVAFEAWRKNQELWAEFQAWREEHEKL